MDVRSYIDLLIAFSEPLDISIKKTVNIFLDRGFTFEEILLSLNSKEKKIALKCKIKHRRRLSNGN